MPRNTDNTDATAFDLDDEHPDTDALRSLVDELDVESPLITSVLGSLIETVDELQDRVDELETQQEATHDIATTAVGNAARNETHLDSLDETTTETRTIARTAVGKAEQAIVDPDQQEDIEQLPAGIEPSTSPLDFFANCQPAKIKEVFVERSNRTNTYRAIAVAKRWKEFGTSSHNGDTIAFDRDDLRSALTAELGEKPHRQTVSRVWDKLVDLGGTDLEPRAHRVSNRRDKKDLLVMHRDTAEGLLEERYVDLDLLDGADAKTAAGGVTPVVTRAEG